MKRILVLVLVAVFAVGFSMSAFAASGKDKDVKVKEVKAKEEGKVDLKVTAGGTVGTVVGFVEMNTTAKGGLHVMVQLKGAAPSKTFTVTQTVDGVATQIGTVETDKKGKGEFHKKTTMPATQNASVVVSVTVGLVGPPAVTYATDSLTLKYKK